MTRKTITIGEFGMTFTALCELPGGLVLGAHKNGPAIVGTSSVYSLTSAIGSGDATAERLACVAIEAYIKESWPLVLAKIEREIEEEQTTHAEA